MFAFVVLDLVFSAMPRD